ncbi:MAG: endonuclease/exonuclease/phosphatase family protein [Kiritimatiellae bacterium]|nr:endonuclease/exonuclease/phosphatase family protein [Kiritimatiellia bacterium]
MGPSKVPVAVLGALLFVRLSLGGGAPGASGPLVLGVGTELSPYTVSQAIALPLGSVEYWGQGYIVGGRYDDFTAPFYNDWGVSVADDPNETNLVNCLQVKLEDDGGRSTWGLLSHPENLGRLIRFKGFRDTYGNYPSFEGINVADISQVLVGGNSLQFVDQESSVSESNGVVVVLITRSNGTGAASAQVQVSGSATLNVDFSFIASATNVVFADGETSYGFELAVVDDLELEGPETVTLDLVNLIGADPGPYLQYALTIEDNDAVPTPPVLQTIESKTVFLGADLLFAVMATETDGDPVTLTASNLPPGAVFTASGATGLFAWSNAAPAGTSVVTFYAEDDDGVDTQAVNIEVSDQQITFTVMAANLSAQSSECETVQGPSSERIFRALAPDIVAMQEWNVTNAGGYRAFVDANFGTGFSYYVENESACAMPNGIISRWPIIASGEWQDTQLSNRDFAWATIDIPGSVDLHVVSVHLKADATSADIDKRELQTRALTNYLAQLPGDDYIVVAGDFNIHSTSEACYQILSTTLNDDHKPVDRVGDRDTNIPRNERYDYIFPNDRLNALHATCTVAGVSFPEGLVFLDSQWSPPPSPVLSGDSTAPGIQHLAVMKAFTITAEASPGPSIDPVADRSILLGGTLTVPLAATSGEGSPISLTLSNQPAGAVFTATAGIGSLIWSNASPLGSYTVTVHAANAAGATQQLFVIRVDALTTVLDVGGYFLYQTNGYRDYLFAQPTLVPPGGYLVVSRASDQAAFEAYWGVTLGANVTFVNSGNDLPQLNGDEVFWLAGPDNTILDGPTPIPMGVGKAIVRGATGEPSTLALSWQETSETNATPGSGAVLSGTGGLVLTEISDASGTGNYIYEFVEIVYDVIPGPTDPDGDGDGMDDAWELANFGTVTSAWFTSDTDLDGFMDGHEYLAGTSPTNPLSYLSFDAIHEQAAGGFDLLWLGVSGRSYRVVFSPQSDSGYLPVQTNIPAALPLTSVQILMVATNQTGFYRIELE